MLQQFTWSHFLIAAAVLTFLWYLSLLLTIFRRDVIGYFSDRREYQDQIEKKGDDYWREAREAQQPDLMGKSRLPDGLDVVSMSALGFGQRDVADDGKLGFVPDVLEELKEVFSTLASEDGNKQDFFALVSIVNEKYGSIGSHPNLAQINDFIKERAPFEISDEELEGVWS